MPGLVLTTDIIVGFPGETEEDFRDTLSLVEAVAFDDAFTFRYSARDGTPATRLKDVVPDHVAGERLQRPGPPLRRPARRQKRPLGRSPPPGPRRRGRQPRGPPPAPALG